MNIRNIKASSQQELMRELSSAITPFNGQDATVNVQIGFSKDGSCSANVSLQGIAGTRELEPMEKLLDHVSTSAR